MKHFYQAVVLLVLGLVTGAAALAQATSGELVGIVADQSGALLPNATVVATNQNTGVKYPAIATGKGEYRIVNILPGTYTITASADGFTSSTVKDFAIDVNKTSTADFKLLPGSTSSVEVSIEASVSIDTTSSQLQQTFGARELTDLPTASASILNLSLLAPGVSSTGGLGEGTGPSISGQRARNNSFTVEGVDNNNKSVTGNVVNIQNDAVGEFTLLQNVFNAEYGHSNGGQFNVALKSGTNHFHGKAFEYFQNKDLFALDNSQKLEGLTSQPRYDNNRYGGQVGGPILKDKLFFFADYEQQPIGAAGGSEIGRASTAAGYTTLTADRPGTNLTVLQKYLPAVAGGDPSGICNNYTYTDPVTQKSVTISDVITLTAPAPFAGGVGPNGDQVTIPVGAASTPAPSFSNGRYIAASVDYVISPKDNLRVRDAYDREDGIDTAASLPVFFAPQPFRSHLASITEVHNFTPNLLNEVRLGYNRGYGPVVLAPGVFPGLNTFPNLDLDDLGISLGPDGSAPQGGAQNFYQLVDNVTYVKGHHTMKFGFDGRKYIAYTDFVQRSRGEYEYSNTADIYLKDLSPDVFGQRNASGATSTRYYGDQTAFYGFGQDDWRVSQKLTLNLGLRYEFTAVPAGEKIQALDIAASVPGLISFAKPEPYKKAFAPRIGFAYAPNAETSVRAGFAIGYDVLFDNIGTTLAPPQQQVTENVDTSVSTTGFLAGGGLAANAASTYASVAAQRAASTHYIPNQALPYTESYSLGVEHVFHHDYTAEVRYVGNHSIHLDTQHQINVFAPINATNNIPTYIGTAPASAATSTVTLAKLKAAAAGTGHILPAYAAAGFTNAITGYLSDGASNYNGLQTQLTRRFQKGLLANFAYTFAKTMDNSTDDFNSTSLNPRRAQDQTNYQAEYSLSALSHKHRFTAEVVYDLPFFAHSNFLLKNTVGNWEVAPVYTYESGQFVTPQAGLDANLNGDSAGDRAIINPGGNKSKGSSVGPIYNPALSGLCAAPATTCAANLVGYQAADPTAYYIATASGAFATAGRSMLPTPAINNLDMTAVKRISFTDRYKFEFQAIAFNALNHPQYTTGSADGVFGVSTVGSAYQAYAIPGKTQFLQPKAVFGSNARTMTLVAKFFF